MGSWTLLIDFGGALTIAAALEDDTLRLIDFDGVPWTPSAVCWSENRRELLAGRAAERVSVTEPWRGEERLGSRLGEDHLLLAGERVPVVDAVAALLAHVTRQVTETAGGRQPAAVWLTAPAGSAQAAQLRAAANAAGLAHAVLVPAPVAVAASLPRARLRPGDRVAVYDLGATGFEACVLVRTGDSFEPIGQPRRVEGGGDELDRKLVRALNERLAREGRQSPAPHTSEESLSRASRAFIESVRAAKEQLSRALTASVELPPPLEGALGISRAELESLIESDVRETVGQLEHAIAQAGGVSAVCLAGGGAKIALVGRLIADELGLIPEADADPGTAAVRGLAELSRRASQDAPAAAAAEDRREPDVVNALDEDVQFTVYRPQCVEPGRWYALLAFAHKSDPVMDEILGVCDPVEEVRNQAAARLGSRLSSYARTEQDSSYSLARGSELTFVPRADGVEFNPPIHTFCWQEPVHQEEFRMRADARLRGTRARGAVSVYLGALLIAEVSLNIRVGDTRETAASGVERARPYRRIFFSYSRKDTAVVDQVEQVLFTLGDEVMRDMRTLRAGEVWDERIEQMIRDAEIFQLFWSTHSMTSKFVTKEWRYALALKRPNFIRPTYWEQPMPELPDADLPPAQLRELHFHPLPASAIPHPPGGSTTTTGAAPSASNAQAMPPSAPAGAAEPPAPASQPPPAMVSQSWEPDGTGAALPAPASARRAARPRFMQATAGLSGLALIALVAAVVGGSGLAGSGSSSRPPVQTAVQATTHAAAPAEERASATPPAQSPQGPSCAGCRAAGSDCPECVVREGTGTTDIGPITSAEGFLTWKNEGGGLFLMMLDGRVVVHSTAGEGRLVLPELTYSDLRIDALGAWSIAIH